jgi:putative flavoprotein involved in K+ transport
VTEREVVVVGAGPSGLAAAAAARSKGADVVVLEAGEAIAHRWRNHYDRLHLQALRRREGLPGRPMPKRVGRWVSRDAYTEYLEQLAADTHAQLEFGRPVERIDPDGGRWRVSAGTHDYRARHVVVATGQDRTERMPDWPGLDSFSGAFIHSRGYRNPAPYAGKDVLVVGGGQSAAEIAVDLVEGGAARVRMSIRSAPVILPRQFTRFVCIQDVLSLASRARLPQRVLDWGVMRLHRLYAGDLTPYGIASPSEGLMARMARGAALPILDAVGFVGVLRSGRIEVVPAVEGFDGADVICGGERLRPDAVIAATGFAMDLAPLVGHLGVLDERGSPRVLAPEAALPGLYFLGYEPSPAGLLWKMARQSPRMAEAMFAGQSR